MLLETFRLRLPRSSFQLLRSVLTLGNRGKRKLGWYSVAYDVQRELIRKGEIGINLLPAPSANKQVLRCQSRHGYPSGRGWRMLTTLRWRDYNECFTAKACTLTIVLGRQLKLCRRCHSAGMQRQDLKVKQRLGTSYHQAQGRRAAASDCICDAGVAPDPRPGAVNKSTASFDTGVMRAAATEVVAGVRRKGDVLVWQEQRVFEWMLATRTEAQRPGWAVDKALTVVNNAKRPFPSRLAGHTRASSGQAASWSATRRLVWRVQQTPVASARLPPIIDCVCVARAPGRCTAGRAEPRSFALNVPPRSRGQFVKRLLHRRVGWGGVAADRAASPFDSGSPGIRRDRF
jgi:hypothetical protein